MLGCGWVIPPWAGFVAMTKLKNAHELEVAEGAILEGDPLKLLAKLDECVRHEADDFSPFRAVRGLSGGPDERRTR